MLTMHTLFALKDHGYLPKVILPILKERAESACHRPWVCVHYAQLINRRWPEKEATIATSFWPSYQYCTYFSGDFDFDDDIDEETVRTWMEEHGGNPYL